MSEFYIRCKSITSSNLLIKFFSLVRGSCNTNAEDRNSRSDGAYLKCMLKNIQFKYIYSQHWKNQNEYLKWFSVFLTSNIHETTFFVPAEFSKASKAHVVCYYERRTNYCKHRWQGVAEIAFQSLQVFCRDNGLSLSVHHQFHQVKRDLDGLPMKKETIFWYSY